MVVQRVTSASVRVGADTVASIGRGLCVFLGITPRDDPSAAARLAERVWQLRIFDDGSKRMDLSAAQLGLELLVVSQFTLYASTERGRRPSFADAASADTAEPLVEEFVRRLRDSGAAVSTGTFGAHMNVSLTNDGPVTLVIDS